MGRSAILAVLLPMALLACTPEVPALPSYAEDVAPILMAHCVRCHGANDMLNPNPDVAGRPIDRPRICYLQRYDDAGDCTDPNAAACRHGARYCGQLMGTTSLITSRVLLAPDEVLVMPPPPGAPLNDWEKGVLVRWSTANPAP